MSPRQVLALLLALALLWLLALFGPLLLALAIAWPKHEGHIPCFGSSRSSRWPSTA